MSGREEVFPPTLCAQKCGAPWEKVCRVCLGPLCAAHHGAGRHPCKPAEDRSAFYGEPDPGVEPADDLRSVPAARVDAALSGALGSLKGDAAPAAGAFDQFDGAVSALWALGILTDAEWSRWRAELDDARNRPGGNGPGGPGR